MQASNIFIFDRLLKWKRTYEAIPKNFHCRFAGNNSVLGYRGDSSSSLGW
jgi:hypothetical protein